MDPALGSGPFAGCFVWLHSCEVMAGDMTRNEAAVLCIFLDGIDRVADPIMKIHFAMDNALPHPAKATPRGGLKPFCCDIFG